MVKTTNCIKTSYPEFSYLLYSLGAKIDEILRLRFHISDVNIYLILELVLSGRGEEEQEEEESDEEEEE